MTLTAADARVMQEHALAHAWRLPEPMQINRSIKRLPGGWAVAMSVNR